MLFIAVALGNLLVGVAYLEALQYTNAFHRVGKELAVGLRVVDAKLSFVAVADVGATEGEDERSGVG